MSVRQGTERVLSMNASVLRPEEKEYLLRWTRRVIENAVSGGDSMRIPDSDLGEGLRSPYGAFVTIKKHGELRGCIGRMDFDRPLWENATYAAVGAALHDPRFPPLDREELPAIRLEISVMDVPQDLPQPDQFDPQRHGIIVEQGCRRALLLPKVAQEYGWTAKKTLECVCQKAGLAPDAWAGPEARLQVFTTCDFAEPDARPGAGG